MTDMLSSGISTHRPASPPRQDLRRRPPARIARRLFLSIGLLAFLTHCATEGVSTPPAAPRLIGDDFAMPPFYRVTGPNGASLLLLGTIHLGPASGWQFSRAVADGLEDADRFVLEVDLREATEEAVSNVVASMVIIEPPNELPDVVSPETARLLEENDAELAGRGMPINARRRLKPWFIAMGLIEQATVGSGYSTGEAVEIMIMRRLGARPLVALESFEEQMEMLNGLSWENQDVLLRDTLLRLDSAVDDVRDLVAAWRVGDEEALEDLSRVGVDELPELDAIYDILGPERNRRWMGSIRPLLDDRAHAGETILVAVGALHLIGEDGLVDLLREAGYPVARVDHFAGAALEGGGAGSP